LHKAERFEKWQGIILARLKLNVAFYSSVRLPFFHMQIDSRMHVYVNCTVGSESLFLLPRDYIKKDRRTPQQPYSYKRIRAGNVCLHADTFKAANKSPPRRNLI
jgi:hypothetical protein